MSIDKLRERALAIKMEKEARRVQAEDIFTPYRELCLAARDQWDGLGLTISATIVRRHGQPFLQVNDGRVEHMYAGGRWGPVSLDRLIEILAHIVAEVI